MYIRNLKNRKIGGYILGISGKQNKIFEMFVKVFGMFVKAFGMFLSLPGKWETTHGGLSVIPSYNSNPRE